MGFWSTFLSEQKCCNCNSYNTIRLEEGDPRYDRAIYSLYELSKYDGTIKKIYQCQDCGRYTWYDRKNTRWYTSDND